MSRHIPQDDVSSLFPAHLRVDGQMRITRIGPSLAVILPALRPGESLGRAFVVPQIATTDDLSRIAAACGTVTLLFRDKGLVLAGPVLAEPLGFFLALQFRPSSADAGSTDFQIEDFSLADPIARGMPLIRRQRDLFEEVRRVEREMDEERVRSAKLIERTSRTSAYAAHDFNNLLSIVALNANLLRKHGPLTARQGLCLNVIEDTIARGSDVTRVLMALADERNSAKSLHPVDRLIGDYAASLRAMAGSKIVLDLDLAASDVWINVSRNGLSQCLVNLVINAREAMPDGGRLIIASRITARPEEPISPTASMSTLWVDISVRDTGSGMTEEEARHAFELFFSTKKRGSGLGLASVQDFVQEHGGFVSLDSAPGEGLTVLLRLPAKPAPDYSEFPPPPYRRAVGRPTVLIVEDDPFALDALSELLEDEGYAVVRATCCEDALRVLAEIPCDVLLSDLILPGASGMDLARQATSDHPALQVVLMSALEPNQNEIANGWGFLHKPIDPLRLRHLLWVACKQAGNGGSSR